jgi:2-oxoglutarate dehydrogenase E2 component (dihydrolipoamide succinyltransferase)
MNEAIFFALWSVAMAVDVKVPAVGESIQEAMIHKWYKKTGDYVEKDEVLMEIETDKATVTIPAETAGVLEILKKEGVTVAIGETVARIDASAKASAAPKADKPEVKAAPALQTVAAPSHSAATTLSPAVRRVVTESNVDPQSVSGSGKGGRLTKGDVLSHLENATVPAAAPAFAAAPAAKAAKAPEIKLPTVTRQGGERVERREPMSMLRRRIAERLVQAQTTAAILTTFNEVDMSRVMDLRKTYKDSFKDQHGIGLGFMSFFVKAAIEALKAHPAINGWIEGNEIVYHDYYDIGVAVSGDRGLVVPVVRDVDLLSMADVEKAIAFYAGKARDGKIAVEDLSGGTFTISNGGTFGSLLSTPILNPPQSAILGMHKIEERPVAVNGQVVIRPMMYLALSYDHRIVDGKEAVQFLVKIKECVEDPHRLLLGV